MYLPIVYGFLPEINVFVFVPLIGVKVALQTAHMCMPQPDWAYRTIDEDFIVLFDQHIQLLWDCTQWASITIIIIVLLLS